MSARDTYTEPLWAFMSADFCTTRKSLGLTQAQMAERLDIDLRSYADLEHGKNLCSTRVLLMYMLRCKKDRDSFLELAEQVMKEATDHLV